MSNPQYILAGATQSAMITAMVEFKGRNWRRIKREVNKAVRKARQRGRAN